MPRTVCALIYALVAIAAAHAVSARSHAAGEVIVRFEPGSTYIDVPAKINGTLDVTFRLDTGAMGSTIDAATAKKLGIEITPLTPRVGVQGVNSASFQPVVVLDRVAVGEAIVDNMMVMVFTRSPGNTVGLLGMDFLKYFKHELDTPNGTLKISPRAVEADAVDLAALNDDAVERKVRLSAVDRELWSCIGELAGLVSDIMADKSVAKQDIIKACLNHAAQNMDKIATDSSVMSGGSSKGQAAAQQQAVAADAALLRKAAGDAVDELVRQAIMEIVDEQAHLFLIAAEIHRNLGDETGAWQLYARGSRYGEGARAREAAKKAGEIRVRCSKCITDAKFKIKIGAFESAAQMLVEVADGFAPSPMADEASKLLRVYENDRKTGSKVAYARAVVMKKKGEPDQARTLFNEVVRRYPGSLEALKANRDLKNLDK